VKVVLVSETAVCPANSGARLRILHLMRPLASRHQITFLFRASTQEEIDLSRAELEPLGVRLVPILNPPAQKRGIAFYARLALNVFSSQPYTVASHNSPGVRAAIARLATEGVDLWQVEWIAYADAVRAIPGAKLIVTAHNVESIIWQRMTETTPGWLTRWYIRQQWKKVEACERKVYSTVDAAIACTEEDATRLRTMYGAKRVEVVDNGVDVASHENLPRTPEPHTVLYVGSLDSRPNQDAAVALLREVLPPLRVKHPDARLLLVGRAPPPWLTQECQRTPGAELHADVPDVRPFLSRSSVQAVALRVGGGSRLKILEAFAAGLPVVSTRVGAEGIHATDGRELLLVDHPGELVAAIDRLWADPEATQQRADAAKHLARERYDWSFLAGKLEQVWTSV
jgi:glycosyltransferase involved in cell wall biosynthesis